MLLLKLRNQIMHFGPEPQSVQLPGVLIKVLFDTTFYENLNERTGIMAVESTESFFRCLLEQQGLDPERVEGAFHRWTGRSSGA
jgi:hypothetical protein